LIKTIFDQTAVSCNSG